MILPLASRPPPRAIINIPHLTGCSCPASPASPPPDSHCTGRHPPCYKQHASRAPRTIAQHTDAPAAAAQGHTRLPDIKGPPIAALSRHAARVRRYQMPFW